MTWPASSSSRARNHADESERRQLSQHAGALLSLRGLTALSDEMGDAFASNHVGNLALSEPALSKEAMLRLVAHSDVIHMSDRLRKEIRKLAPDAKSNWF